VIAVQTNLTDIDHERIAAAAGSRIEGVALAKDGSSVAVALSDTGMVHILTRRPGTATVCNEPGCILSSTDSSLRYPHDVDFSPDDCRLLAVADRLNSIQIFAKHASDEGYGPEPVCEIKGPESELDYTDGVAFVPPYGDFLAACNLLSDKVTFYRRVRSGKSAFENTPCFAMQGNGLAHPDGLALSSDGRYLATANHGNNSVTIFKRRHGGVAGSLAFYPDPVSVIQDESIRYAHSVAFSPRHHHLILTNAGANYLNIYRCDDGSRPDDERTWSGTPTQQVLAGYESVFAAVNTCSNVEGGPKGVAIDQTTLAVVRTLVGLNLVPYTENSDGLALRSRIRFSLDAVPVPRSGITLDAGSDIASTVRSDAGEVLGSVNSTGRLIWLLCDGHASVATIVGELRTLFPEVATMENDVQAALRGFERAGMIDIQS